MHCGRSTSLREGSPTTKCAREEKPLAYSCIDTRNVFRIPKEPTTWCSVLAMSWRETCGSPAWLVISEISCKAEHFVLREEIGGERRRLRGET